MWLMNNWNRLMKYFQPQIIKTITVPDLSMRRYDNLMTGNSLKWSIQFHCQHWKSLAFLWMKHG